MGVRAEALEHTIVTDRRLATLHHRHALALLAVPTDRRIHRAAGDDHSDDDRLVDATDAARLQLLDQAGLRLQGLGHDHQAGGVLVQAMNDAGARDVDQIRYVMQQRIEQCAVGVARSGVHDQPGGLVDHQNLIILVNDLERYVLRYPFALRLLLCTQFEHRTSVHGIAGAQHSAVHGQQTILDPGGETRARMFGKELRRDLIETLPAKVEWHLGAELDGLFGSRGHTA